MNGLSAAGVAPLDADRPRPLPPVRGVGGIGEPPSDIGCQPASMLLRRLLAADPTDALLPPRSSRGVSGAGGPGGPRMRLPRPPRPRLGFGLAPGVRKLPGVDAPSPPLSDSESSLRSGVGGTSAAEEGRAASELKTRARSYLMASPSGT